MSFTENQNIENISAQILFNSENEDDIEVDYLDKLADTVTWSTDWTIESVISAYKRDSFNISPGFQRRDAWTIKKKSRFIESLIYGLPIPQIVLAEDKKNRGKYLVVDGKQRLITLFTFFSDDYNMAFELAELTSEKLNGISYKKLEENFPDLYNNLLNQSLRSIIIKNWSTENLLYTIFYRLNSGSLPLSPQELRKALKPGAFLDFIDSYCSESNALKIIMKSNKPDPRMRDMDLLLRFFVMTKHITEYKGNYKRALDEICDFYNKQWNKEKNQVTNVLSSFEKTIDYAVKVFTETNVFRRLGSNKNDSRINRAIFDVVCYYFSHLEIENHLDKSDAIINMTNDLCKYDNVFIKSISSNTNNLKETATRFVIYGRKLQEILGIQVNIPSNLKNHFSTIR